jgi:hypothetical protein
VRMAFLNMSNNALTMLNRMCFHHDVLLSNTMNHTIS